MLDLISIEIVKFLLIVAPTEKSYHLARAAFEVAKEFKVSVKVCAVWSADKAKGVAVQTKELLSPWDNYVDVLEVK